MSQPLEQPDPERAQSRAAAVFAAAMGVAGIAPESHQAVSAELYYSPMRLHLSGWRVPTARPDGSLRVSGYDCVIAPDGTVFRICQREAFRARSAALPAVLPVAGLIEGVVETYQRATGSPWPPPDDIPATKTDSQVTAGGVRTAGGEKQGDAAAPRQAVPAGGGSRRGAESTLVVRGLRKPDGDRSTNRVT
jgi:hypothetical protein